MNVDVFVERHLFICSGCGYSWTAAYEVRHVEDGQGGSWDHYSVGGIPAVAPIGRVTCPSCERTSVAAQLIDRRLQGPGTPAAREGRASESVARAHPSEGDVAVADAAAPRPRVAVIAEDSPSGRAALRWAAVQARNLGGILEVLAPYESGAGFGFTPTTVGDDDREARYRARSVVQRSIDEPGLPITISARRGRPGDVLVVASRMATLIVVGVRRHGYLSDLLHGSVAEYCSRHALCPVVVVPSDSIAAEPTEPPQRGSRVEASAR